MGWGDEVIATGEVRFVQEMYGPGAPRVAILDKDDKPRWNDLWIGNPRIVRPDQIEDKNLRIHHGGHCRPYIDYERMKREFYEVYPTRNFRMKVRDPNLPYRFTDAKVRRGELYFVNYTPKSYVIIEPHYKRGNLNRNWGWEKWQTVVNAIPQVDWLQINPPGVSLLKGVKHIPADNFIKACQILAKSILYVGPEGGLYHAAAALGVPSVAIFGGFVSPVNQGYDGEINLYPEDERSPCGMRVECQHCREVMDRISTEEVIWHVKQRMNL